MYFMHVLENHITYTHDGLLHLRLQRLGDIIIEVHILSALESYIRRVACVYKRTIFLI